MIFVFRIYLNSGELEVVQTYRSKQIAGHDKFFVTHTNIIILKIHPMAYNILTALQFDLYS